MSSRVSAWMFACAVAGLGCSGDEANEGKGAGGAPFRTAPHPSYPQLKGHGGRVLENVELVTVTFRGDPLRAKIDAFDDFIVTSNWFEETASEYGAGPGTHLASVVLPSAAPAAMDDDDLRALLEAHVEDGTLPPVRSDVLYLVYVPKETEFFNESILCEGYFGYHESAVVKGERLVYGVVGDCGSFDDLTATAAHEIVESVTDPVRAYWLDVPKHDPWFLFSGQENADLCSYLPYVEEDGWRMQRSWSNASIRDRKAPCVPIPPGEVDYNVAVEPEMPVVPAGGEVTFTLTGWSSAPIDAWTLKTYGVGPRSPEAELAAERIENGATTTLTLTLPEDAGSGLVGGVIVYSGPEYYRFWPVGVVVE